MTEAVAGRCFFYLSIFTSEIIDGSTFTFFFTFVNMLSMVEVNPLPTLRLARKGRKE